MAIWIKKVETTPLNTIAKVIDSLTGSSTTNAPSIHAVNEALDDLDARINELDTKITVLTNNYNALETRVSALESSEESQSVTSDFSIQAYSEYVEGQTDFSQTITQNVTINNAEGYKLLMFDWSNDGSTTGSTLINMRGSYQINESGYFKVNLFNLSASQSVDGSVAIDISDLPSTFTMTFEVFADIRYQYAVSLSKLNISNFVLKGKE